MLIGREHELRALDERIDAASQGGSALVLRGDAGIGKSLLLDEARTHATGRGFRVLTTAGVQSESHLPFAALQRLLHPVLDAVERLPESQSTAVRVAFGLSDGSAPAPFLLALAVLHVLGEVAAHAPLLLLIDDAQWLDDPTAHALAFIARRIESDPVVMLVAIRDGVEGHPLEAGLPERRLEGLAEVDALALLDAREPGLTPALRDRVLREAAGNPLALVELPIALRAAGVTDASPLPPWLPVTKRLEQAFATRLWALPQATRTLLLLAAADEGAALDDLLLAASEVEGCAVGIDALPAAVAAGLVEIDGPRLRFRHPLMRSTIHETSGHLERAAAHSALAAIARDPDRRVWHRAASVIGVDATIATELEGVAVRARRRGAAAISMEALERAAQLAEPRRCGEFLVSAAELANDLGRHADVSRLLRAAERAELAPLDQTRLAWLRELVERESWSGAVKIRAFAEIAERMRLDGKFERALEALSAIALRCWWSNPDEETRRRMVAVAERLPFPEDDPRLLAILGLAGPVERGAIVIDRLSRLVIAPAASASHVLLLAHGTAGVGACAEAQRILDVAIPGLRAQGQLGLLAQALVTQAWTAIRRGRWRLAGSAAKEGTRLAQETAQPLWVTVAELAEATLAAYRGDVATAERLSAAGEKMLLPIGANPMLALVQFPRGVTALALGRHAEAYEQLSRIFDPADVAFQPLVRSWVLIDLVEAALHSDHLEEARQIVAELEPLAGQTRSPVLRAALDYASPLLAPDEHADERFATSLGPRLIDWPFARGRLALAYGVWLRRQRRVADSRGPLRAARDAFDALDAAPWAERARQELRASGETSRSRTRALADTLSPQELQIAQLAAEGMSNKAIGSQLFLSHRTVASHLYRVFPKLGIAARAQLRGALEDRASR